MSINESKYRVYIKSMQDCGDRDNKAKVPVVIAVDSDGRSIHFVLRIDAKNKDSYDSRVNQAYSILKKMDLKLIKQIKTHPDICVWSE